MVYFVAKLFSFDVSSFDLIGCLMPDLNLKIYSIYLDSSFQIIFGSAFLGTILSSADYYSFNKVFVSYYFHRIRNFFDFNLNFKSFIVNFD